MMTGVFLACGLAFGAVTVNVTDFGARGDAVADDTAAFQRALDVAERPLKVVIPKGDWRIVDGLRVSGGTTVVAAPDARIFCCGSRKKTRGYSFLTNRHHDGEGDRAIEIGGGVWDGQVGVGFNRKSFPVKDNPTGWGGRFLEFVNVRDLRLHDMVISNSVTYHVSLCKVDGFDIRRIKLTGTGRLWFNSDGIHLFGHCFNGIIDGLEGLNGQPNDDLLAFNADDYIGRVENFDMLQGPITNVFCSNIRSKNCYTGTRIATDRSLIADVTVSNMVAGIRMSAFTVDSLRHCATPLFRECERPDGAGRLRNVRLVDSSFWVSERKYEGEIANVESNVEGEGLVFRNVRRILEKDAAPERPFFSIRNLRRTDVDFGDRRETVPARAQRTFAGPVLDFTLAPLGWKLKERK